MPDFQWASKANEKGWAKICIKNEAFWVTDCKPHTTKEQKVFIGKVSNELNEQQDLNFGEVVYFVPTLE